MHPDWKRPPCGAHVFIGSFFKGKVDCSKDHRDDDDSRDDMREQDLKVQGPDPAFLGEADRAPLVVANW